MVSKEKTAKSRLFFGILISVQAAQARAIRLEISYENLV